VNLARSSYVALAAGKTEDWVITRTGHGNSQMIALYRRQAKTAAELKLGWLAGRRCRSKRARAAPGHATQRIRRPRRPGLSRYVFRKASRSALMVSASVVGMP
jgi:hypothetical protein